MLYRLLADLTVAVHAGYVAFVVVGELLILFGYLLRWEWIRNPWFRWLHVGAIAVVAAEAVCGITCPLTTLEKWLRKQGGQATYQGDFVAELIHELLFYDAPAWVFTLIYVGFGLLVAATLLLVPPRRFRRQAPTAQQPRA